MDNNDWRLRGQESYLVGVTLTHKKYADRLTARDHDHCEFCLGKFSDTIPESLTEGYTTHDENLWICDTCYVDFKAQFKWELTEDA